MKLAGRIGVLAGKFDRLTIRERLFILVAVVAVLVAAVNSLLLGRLDTRRTQLSQQHLRVPDPDTHPFLQIGFEWVQLASTFWPWSVCW